MNQYMYALAGIFDTLVVIAYFDAVMKRRSIKGISTMIYVTLLLTCVVSYVFERMQWTGGVLGWSLLTLFGLSFFYEETIFRRIFHVFFTQVMAMIAESLCVLMGKLSWVANLLDSSTKDEVELVLSKLLFFLLITIALLFRKEHGRISKRHLLCFLTVPVISIFVVYGLANGGGFAWGISLLGVLFINIIVYYILNLISDYSAKLVREELLQEQIRRQRENYEQLSQSFKKRNRMLHDINKHMRQVEQYLEQEEWGRASCYLKQIQGNFQENYRGVKCGNIVIDSILSNLKGQIETFGSTFELEMYVDKTRLHIDDYDLVTILGNISDNVIEEMKRTKLGTVYFRLETTENELLIHVKNPWDPNKIKSDKKNQWFHGLGLENIKETVQRYEGSASFERNGDQFETMIMVPYEEVRGNVC